MNGERWIEEERERKERGERRKFAALHEMGRITIHDSRVTGLKAPAHVVFTGDFSDRYTGGVRQFEIEASTLRGIIKALDERYPGLGEHLEKETTVAIDGEIHEVVYFEPVRPGCEVFFIPRIEGG